ncbi:MAG: hypothetical protein R6V20_00215 [Desulfobia sp.]
MAVSLIFADPGKGAEHDFSIGLETRYMDYEEPGLMEEDGTMYGVAGKYTFYGNNLMSEISLKYLEGELDYDGETQAGTPVKTETEDWLVEARYLLGREVGFATGMQITPFVGIGYRYWKDDICGPGGYERDVTYWYSPVGLKFSTPLAGCPWSLGIYAEYDFFWSGKVKSYMSDYNAGYNDPEMDQDCGDGYGLRLSVAIKRDLGPEYALAVEPYIIYWDIDRSDSAVLYHNGSPQAFVYEPENETTSYGCRISLMF